MKSANGSGTNDQGGRWYQSHWYLALAVLAVMLMQHILAQGYYVKPIPYSDFKTLLRQGKIVEVTVSEQAVSGTLRDSEAPDGVRTFSTVRIADPDLLRDLEAKGVRFAGRLPNRLLQSLLSMLVPISLMLLVWHFAAKRMKGMSGGLGGAGILGAGRSRAKLISPDAENRVTFAEVAGIDEVKEELEEVVDFLKTPEKFEELGGRIPKGILLVGAPGTGKTLLARAVAGEAGAPFFSISGSEFVEMFVGVGASRVRDMFSQAAAKAPCIVFIDELDAIGKARGSHSIGGHDEREQTLNQLLVEMDGFDVRKGVIVMAATNRPEILDPALLRPGRFDRQISVGRPDFAGREAILAIHARTVKLSPQVDLRRIAAQTPGFAGADLANLVNESALLAARRGRTEVGMKEFEEAIERVVAGLEKKRVIRPKEKRIVAFHEAGHALVAASVPTGEPVHRISIIPRGVAALGYTMQFPLEDRYLLGQSELEDRLAVLLGGRAAEEVVFGEVTTGAQNDLVRATETARAMVTEYGMSERLGLAVYKRQGGSFLGSEYGLPGEREYSERIASTVDEEVKGLLDRTYERVKQVLAKRRELLDRIAHALLERETLDRDEFEQLVLSAEGTSVA